MKYFLRLILVTWSICCISVVHAKNSPFFIHSESHKITLKADGMGTHYLRVEMELLTPEGINLVTPFNVEYDSTLKEIAVEEAYVVQPDGSKIKVAPEAIFTRPSLASTEAPGFVHTMTLSIVFPNLQVGSRVVYNLKGIIKKQGPFGFLWMWEPRFYHSQKKFTFELRAPLNKDFPLQIAQTSNKFKISDSEDSSHKERVIKASFHDWKGCQAESGMIAPINWLPSFFISSLKTWEDIAAIYIRENKSQSVPDKAVRALAKSIVGSKKGKEAVKVLYDWVAQNISYLFVSMDPTTAIKAHTAAEVLQAKYGDCKDKTTLLQALLKAVDIYSTPVLVNLTGGIREFTVLPYPLFNHVMLYIPAYNVFADPTDRFASLGTLSSDLSETPALFVQEKNPARKLPAIDPKDHTYKVKATLHFGKNGLLEGKNIIETTGEAATEYRAFFCRPGTTAAEIGSDVLRMTPEGGTGVFEPEDIYNLTPSFSFASSWKTPKMLILEEETSFPIPYGLDPRLSIPFLRGVFTHAPRKYPFEMRPGIDIWEYTIAPPKGYTFTRIPENRFLDTPGALYKGTYTLEKGLLHVNRRLEIKKAIFTPQEATELLDPVELFLFDLRQSVFLKKEK